jgi:hypothetical protein
MNNEQRYKELSNGVVMLTTANGKLMHKCNYCESWFKPLRRFMQKYCNDSCRVMACRKRKRDLFGLVGGNFRDRKSTTNTDLFEIVSSLKQEIDDLKDKAESDYENIAGKILSSKTDIRCDIIDSQSSIQRDLTSFSLDSKKDLIALKKLQNWNIAISIIMPLLAPFIGGKMKEIFNPNKPFEDMESFLTKISPFLDKAPKELRDNIYSSMSTYFEQSSS